MLDGRVTVNGATIRELGTKADPSRDDIRVDGRRVKPVTRHRYLLLNKPRGYVTTRSDEKQRPTVIDLLRGINEYVYPVGRLDYESEGLLLLTNARSRHRRAPHRGRRYPAAAPQPRRQRGHARRDDPRRPQPPGAEDVRCDRPSGRALETRRHRTDPRPGAEDWTVEGVEGGRGQKAARCIRTFRTQRNLATTEDTGDTEEE